jgi:hypothetical protein
MQGSAQNTTPVPDVPSSHNAFTPSFLRRFAEYDEPPTAGEADTAGPWRIVEIPGGCRVRWRISTRRPVRWPW